MSAQTLATPHDLQVHSESLALLAISSLLSYIILSRRLSRRQHKSKESLGCKGTPTKATWKDAIWDIRKACWLLSQLITWRKYVYCQE